ncbi:MAG: AAA family ATPase [Devosia sp.]|nr:AAA family ATPase [Devosia sp.]
MSERTRTLCASQSPCAGRCLNVIVGDNETGKSTLLAATCAALFERHRVTGQVVDDMLPYGRQVRPTIEIDFSKDGADYRLLKAFGSRPEARLIGTGGLEWAGDEADEALIRILGFTRPGPGESKPDQHHGLFGMTWVSQGTAHHTPKLGAVREQVAGAIEREVGEVAGRATRSRKQGARRQSSPRRLRGLAWPSTRPEGMRTRPAPALPWLRTGKRVPNGSTSRRARL